MTDIDYKNLKPHQLATLFPAYGEDEIKDLAEDIKANGLQQKITLYEGQILDGVNRWRALTMIMTLGVQGAKLFTEYQGKDPTGFVVSMNLKRRHLTTAQRAQIAADLATMKSGTRTDKDLGPNGPRSVADATKLMNVSERSVKRATALRKTNPALAEEIKQGKAKPAKPVKIASERPSPKKSANGKAQKSGVETKRHDTRMKSARYALEAFIRDYADTAEWKEVIEAIKTQLGAKHV